MLKFFGVFESRLCQGLSLAGSCWSDMIGPREEDSATRRASGFWSLARGCGLEKACHSTGSRDLAGAARDEVYAVDLSSMGG